MKRILLCLLLLIIVANTNANHIDKWLYWFDDDFDSAVETILDEPVELLVIDTIIDVEVANLNVGVHRLNFMFRDTADNWKILSRNFYYLPDDYGQLSSYEYWLDGVITNKIKVNITETNFFIWDGNIDVTGLPLGLHFVTVRFKTNANMYSIPLTRMFYRTQSLPATNQIVTYQYWFGNDYTNGDTVNIAGEEFFFLDDKIDFSNLTHGLNSFTVRFKDSGELWSIPLTRYFYNTGTENLVTDNEIVSYQYWFGNDTANVTTANFAGVELFLLDETFEVDSLPQGINAITIRFKDKAGYWSTPLTRYFYNIGSQAISGGNTIKAYRYWFNNDSASTTYAEFKSPMVEIDFANNLQIPAIEEQQNHMFGIQFMDQNGIWSVPISQEFFFDEYGIAAPYLIAPADNHNESLTQFNLQWADQAAIEKYQLQVSTKSDFSSTIVDIDDIEELTDDIVEFELLNLNFGYKYFWRVRSIKGADISLWSEEWNFITGLANQDISLSAGWNIISTFINPQDADIASMLMPIEDDVVIVKNNLGQIYYPEFGINDIGNWNILEGYQVYMTNAATLSLEGFKIVPEDNPIELNTGWNIISYFRTTPQNIETAMMSLTDDEALIIAKNNLGQIFYPEFGINDIENMLPGQGYQIYLIKSSTLFYQGN
ncbi:MAG: hypothetical protein M9949_12105 [Candidatus Kapabacteria bacterium]|nr:hypothetical protein [Candidatus Kapabacteria bacterium]